MNNPIQDSAAIEFARGFYDGLGYKIPGNQDVFQRAFDEGMVAIEMEGISEHLTPILISNNKAKSTHIESSSSEQVSLVPQHEYELLVKNLLQSRLIENIPGKDLEVRHNACYTGKSGYEHQIGVSAEMKIAGVRFLILVDCKNHSKLVEANEVLEIASRIEDIGAQKGIIVTTRGFQSGAIQLAKSKGVALIIACDLKWEIYAENIGRDISLRQNFIRKGLRLLQRTTKLDENRLSVLYAQSAECRRGRIVSRFNSATNLDVMGRVTHAYVFVTNSVINGDVEINQITKRFTLENDQFFVLLRDGIFSFIALTTLWSWLALPLPFSNVLGVLNEFRIFLESLRKGDFKQAIELLRQMKNLDSQNWNWWEITNWGWLEIAHALETPECFDKTLKLAHQGEIRDHELIRLIIMIAKRGRYNQVISLANCIQDVWISSSDLDRLIIMIAEKGEYDPAIALTKSIKFELFSNQKRALILGRIASKIAKTGNLVKAANLFGESLQICQENWDGAMSQTSGDFLETNLSRLPKQNEVLIDIVFLATEANLIVQAIQSIKSEKFQAEIIAKITQKVNLIVANPEI